MRHRDLAATRYRLQLIVTRPAVGRVIALLGVHDRLRVQPDLATARRAAT